MIDDEINCDDVLCHKDCFLNYEGVRDLIHLLVQEKDGTEQLVILDDLIEIYNQINMTRL